MTMNITLSSVAFVVAVLCAAVMGFAIQRGATCTVAAIDELVNKRRLQRLASMLEASLWVAGGLALARTLGALPEMPVGYSATTFTVVGGVLLGVGAFVNRACVFGAIARLGSGEWAYVATPIGFYFGCVSLPYLYSAPAQVLAGGSPVLAASSTVILLFLALLAVRVVITLRGKTRPPAPASVTLAGSRALAAHVWTPHVATTVIGIAFVVMFLLVGAWAYTDVLADLARGMSRNLIARFLLLVALFAGAAFGGWTAGRFRHAAITFSRLLLCFAGGTMMGWGSMLIPGGNDGLILIGLPLLWPYAWLAFLTMCVSIAAAQTLANARTSGKSPSVAGTPPLTVPCGRQRRSSL